MIARRSARSTCSGSRPRCSPACCRALYPQMLAARLRAPGRRAGRSTSHGGLAGDGRACSATCSSFDGAVGARSEIVDGRYTGRDGGPFTYREGKAERDARAGRGARASTSPPRTPTPTRSPTCRCCGSSGIRSPSTPTPSWRRVAREEGWEVMRFEQLGRRAAAAGGSSACARPLVRRAARGARGGARAMSLHELTDEQREIRELARRFADEVDRAAAPPRGIASTASRKEVFDAARRARADGRLRPGGARRRGRRLPLLRARAGGALARRRRASASTVARAHERRARCRSSPTARPSRSSGSSRRWRRATSSGRSR